ARPPSHGPPGGASATRATICRADRTRGRGVTRMAQAATGIAARHLDRLRASCADIVTPHDAGYDEGRRLWNAIHDRRPALIARPATAPEVAGAVRFGREHDLEIAIRSGGHSAAGLGGRDG